MNLLKQILAITLLIVSSTAFAQGGGTSVGGGGDASEIRFNDITNDLTSWIKLGGDKYLTLPSGVSLAAYQSEMLALMAPHATVLAFTNDAVTVDSFEKTCRGYQNPADLKPTILCNIDRFNSTDQAGQYRLVHHEFAGLAGLEQNVGASSDYQISDQITDYLEPSTSLRLVVKPAPLAYDPVPETLCTTGPTMDDQHLTTFLGAGNTSKTIGTATLYFQTRSCNSITGCSGWSSASAVGKLSSTIQLVTKEGQGLQPQIVFNGIGTLEYPPLPKFPFALGWLFDGLNYRDGSVNAMTDGYRGFEILWLRSNCAVIRVFNQTYTEKYSASWSF